MTYAYQGPAVISEPSSGPDRQRIRWVLVLSPYQRDNLLWLLNLLGYGAVTDDPQDDSNPKKNYGWAGAVAPFGLASNGDWVGEIAHMLAEPIKRYQEFTPLVGEVLEPLPEFNVRRRVSQDAEKTGKPNSSRAWVIEQLERQYGIKQGGS